MSNNIWLVSSRADPNQFNLFVSTLQALVDSGEYLIINVRYFSLFLHEYMRRDTIKTIKWLVHPTKTQVNFGDKTNQVACAPSLHLVLMPLLFCHVTDILWPLDQTCLIRAVLMRVHKNSLIADLTETVLIATKCSILSRHCKLFNHFLLNNI